MAKIIKKLFKKLKSYEKDLCGLFLIVSIAIAIYSITSIVVAFHNIDICHNEMGIERQMQDILFENGVADVYTLSETTLDGRVWTLDDCYTQSWAVIFKNIVVEGISCFCIGIFFILTTRSE